MSDANNPIPSPQPGDPEDLELALETAQRMYAKGDKAESLKWLRRAANAADEAGDDTRQLQLARLAADLAAVVDAGSDVVTSAPSVAPSAPSVAPNASASPPTNPNTGRLPQPPTKQSPTSTPARTPVPPKPSIVPSGGQPHPPVMASRPPSAPSHPKPAPSTSPAALSGEGSESQVPPARSSEPHTASPAKPSAGPGVKPRPSEASSSSRIVEGKPIQSTMPSSRPDKPMPTSSGAAGDVSGLAGSIRVSVRVSARDEQLLIVRPLAEGQRLPPNSRAARLVFEQEPGSLPGQSTGE